MPRATSAASNGGSARLMFVPEGVREASKKTMPSGLIKAQESVLDAGSATVTPIITDRVSPAAAASIVWMKRVFWTTKGEGQALPASADGRISGRDEQDASSRERIRKKRTFMECPEKCREAGPD